MTYSVLFVISRSLAFPVRIQLNVVEMFDNNTIMTNERKIKLLETNKNKDSIHIIKLESLYAILKEKKS